MDYPTRKVKINYTSVHTGGGQEDSNTSETYDGIVGFDKEANQLILICDKGNKVVDKWVIKYINDNGKDVLTKVEMTSGSRTMTFSPDHKARGSKITTEFGIVYFCYKMQKLEVVHSETDGKMDIVFQVFFLESEDSDQFETESDVWTHMTVSWQLNE